MKKIIILVMFILIAFNVYGLSIFPVISASDQGVKSTDNFVINVKESNNNYYVTLFIDNKLVGNINMKARYFKNYDSICVFQDGNNIPYILNISPMTLHDSLMFSEIIGKTVNCNVTIGTNVYFGVIK